LEAKKFLGIDLGGTKIEAIVIDERLKVISRPRVPTNANQGYEMILGQIKKVIQIAESESGVKFDQLGIGTPGSLDPTTGFLRNSNTVSLNGKPFLKDLKALMNVEIRIENDANCFALSEANYLINKGEVVPILFGIILGSGVGGGIIIDGKLLSGTNGIGGEWGHIFLDDSGGDCYCGKTGCVETVLAGKSLERFYEEQTGKFKKLKEIVLDHRSNNPNPATIKTMERLFEFFGKEFLKPHFGDSSGVFGAALLWK